MIIFALFSAYVRDFGYPERYSSATIVVKVTDVNDNLPMFVKDEVSLSIPENTEQRAIHQVVAKDLDTGDNARLSYAIISTYYATHYAEIKHSYWFTFIFMCIKSTGELIKIVLYTP